MSDAPRLVLYGREGCHLCDEARDDLVRMGEQGLEFDLVDVDIESDPDLLRRNLERIPVIEIDGEEVCELGIDHSAVRARLASL
jgi:glutathione S-transferase